MPQQKKCENLSDFIENNEKLLATLGVFGALTAFFHTVNAFLSLIVLFIFLILSLELFTKFPNWKNWREWNKGAINLFIFRISFFLLVLGVVIYSFNQHQEFFVLFVIEISLICLMAFGDTLIPKIKKSFYSYMQNHEKISLVFAYFISGLILLGFAILAVFIFGLLLALWNYISPFF